MTLNPDQFRLSIAEGAAEERPHMVLAHKGDQPVGYMAWNPGYGEIEDIEVHPEHRRQGVATAMYKHAQDWADKTGEQSPEHSTLRTPAGFLWSNYVSPRQQSMHITDLPAGKFSKKRFMDHFADGYSGEHEGY